MRVSGIGVRIADHVMMKGTLGYGISGWVRGRCSVDKYRVVVIDDRSESVVIVRRLLERAGVAHDQVLWSKDGYDLGGFEAGLDGVELVLLDISLSSAADGYEVLEKVRGKTWGSRAKIVAVTGHVSPEDVRRARDAGFDGFLGKPLDVKRFPDQFRRLMSGEAVWEGG